MQKLGLGLLMFLLTAGAGACRRQAVQPPPPLVGSDEAPSGSPSQPVESPEPAAGAAEADGGGIDSAPPDVPPQPTDLPDTYPPQDWEALSKVEALLMQAEGLLMQRTPAEALDILDRAEAMLEEPTLIARDTQRFQLLGWADELRWKAQSLARELEDLDAEPEIEPSPLDQLGSLELYTIEVDPALEELVTADLRETGFDIPVVLNQRVLQFLDYYQGRGRRIMEVGLQRSGRYLDFFRRVFEAEEVPRDLTYLPHVESLFKPRAYSRARARGLWQFVQATARKYGMEVDWWIDERSNVEKSTVAAARHLRDLYQEFGDWYLALAAYNSGPGRIRRHLARHESIDYWEMSRRRLLPRETRNYVPSFLAALIIFKHPEKYGFVVEPDPPMEFEEVPLEFQVDLRVVADLLELKTDELLDLNPQLRRGVTPYQRPGFSLKVPVGRGDTLAEQLRALPEEERLRVQHYRVRSGDTLSGIALRFGSSVRAIAQMNRIRNVHRLRLGQDLLIPSAGWRGPPLTPVRTETAARPSSYVVRRGDSLYLIARRFGLTVAQLAAWNNLRPNQTIFPGQRLQLRQSPSATAGKN